MGDEIKEILEDVKRHLDYVEATKQASIRDNEMKAMYDYITNLQEEIEDYKSRNEKAIEYIRNNMADIEFIKKRYRVIIDDYVETTIDDIEKLLTILTGGDKE